MQVLFFALFADPYSSFFGLFTDNKKSYTILSQEIYSGQPKTPAVCGVNKNVDHSIRGEKMALLNVKNLSLGYDNQTIVENLSFTVNAGDYLCIVGENGSGKTTLMKTLLRLKQPLSGEIEIGEELAGGEIGYLPQQTNIQKDFPASVIHSSSFSPLTVLHMASESMMRQLNQ